MGAGGVCDFFCKYIALIDKIDTAVPEIEIYLLLLLQWEQKKLFKEYGVVNFKQNILPWIKKSEFLPEIESEESKDKN